MMTGRVLRTGLAALAFLAATAARPGVAFSQDVREIEEGLSSVDAIRELRDGRVLILDSDERRVRIADFERGGMGDFGRRGSGPGEYQAPVGLFSMPGDSTAIFDGPSGRVLMFAPDGKPADVINSAGMTVKSPGAIMRFVPRSADASGRLYAVGTSVAFGPTGPRLADSLAVTRWDRRAPAGVVVAWARVRSLRDRGGDVDPEEAIFRSLVPFMIGDQVAVAPDGRIAILRWDRYAVDFVVPGGGIVHGPELAAKTIPVTDEAKAEWREERQASQGGRVSEPPRWPDVMPPFLSRPAIFAPDGVLWVKRTTEPGSPALYDLVSPTGTLQSHRTFMPRERVVGFGTRYIYTVRTDEDDLQYLRRHTR
jgi:hypothetical protein